MSLSMFVIAFQVLYFLYFVALNSYYLGLNFAALFFLRKRNENRVFTDMPKTFSGYELPISIIVPAYNEEKTIEASVRALIQMNYPQFEVIVVNDGSTDSTMQVLIEAFDLMHYPEAYRRTLEVRAVHGFYRSARYPNIRVIDKENGGKSDALNAGINTARYPLFCCIDADSILTRENMVHVAFEFLEDATTVACGGTIRVANGCEFKSGLLRTVGLPRNPLALIQTIEYLRAFLFGRLGWVSLNGLLIISGSFSLFRKKDVVTVGGYSSRTVSEDMELIVRLHRHFRLSRQPYRIFAVPEPICFTEVPEDLRSLRNQRVRWQRGLAESMAMNSQLLFHPRAGTVGWLAYPLNIIFEWIGPLFELGGYLFFIIGFFVGFISLQATLAFLILSVGFSLFISIVTLFLEEFSFHVYPKPGNLIRLFFAAILENLGFRQLNTFWRVQGILGWLFRRQRAWGRIERRGTRGA